ncbi:MAG: aromatic amino acid lyase [Akkermansiaceae bacterium]|nr:aromatic amino acid lyase [Armatimonadota bacterium]
MSDVPREIPIGYGETLTCEAVEAATSCPVTLSNAAWARIEASYRDFLRHVEKRVPIYGTTTGFGPHVVSATGGAEAQGASLIAHLGAGYGPDAPQAVARGAMVLRLHTVGQGYSAVRPEAATAYLALTNSGVVPCVPETGSVGASGDLVPLAHIARVLTGGGEAFYKGNRLSGSVCLRLAGLAPIELTGRDALALVNGTSFLGAYSATAVARTSRLIRYAETLTGWLYRLLGCRTDATSADLNRMRGHDGQVESARHIRSEAGRFGEEEDTSRPLQEVYSLRCAPQVLGACRDSLQHARTIVEREMNGIDDNPVIFPDSVLHGGNFHGQAVGFAADTLNAAITQIAVLAERQIAILCTPSRHNDFAPLLLAYEPGRDSGLSGAQLTATALLAEMRGACQQYATSSIPTNADNQDVVPMATLAAQSAYRQTERLAGVLAVLHIAAFQLDFLRGDGKAAGRTSPAPPDFPTFEPLRSDRALQTDIRWVADAFLRRELAPNAT